MDPLNDELEVLDIALRWLQAGRAVVLGTVIRTSGSAPRLPGSHIAIRDDGAFAGSLSAGCIEGKIIEAALAVMETRRPKRLAFGSGSDTVFDVALMCGGDVEILLEPILKTESLESLLTAGGSLARAVNLETGEERLIDPTADTSPLGRAANAARQHRQGRTLAIDGEEWFVTAYERPWELVIVGAVHIAQALCRFAAAAGHDVRVIDPRPAYLSEERFPDVPRFLAWPDEAFAAAPLTPASAVIVLAHDPKIDDPALVAALRSDCAYVGALGSLRTHAKRTERLSALGVSAEAIGRIHAPIGLAIDARSPTEIALAILAEIVQEQRRAAART